MESNRDEAEKCLELGKKYENEGHFEKASRFYTKSLHLFPTPTAKQYLVQIEIKIKQKTNVPEDNRSRTEKTKPNTEKPTNKQQRDYTPEQLEMATQIKKAKDYYEVLGLKRDCSDAEIKKKKYKKLALQLHPDKNGAPGAEDAFKKVSQAFSCLSDSNKRSMYDVRGTEEESGPRVRHAYDEDRTAEEIFTAFFGGVPVHRMHQRRGPTAFRTYTYTNGDWADSRRRYYAQDNTQQSNFWGCLQLLPIFMIFLLGYLSSPSEPIFQFQQTAKFSQKMITKHDIQYWVKQDFHNMYDTSNGGLKQLEQLVEQTWIKEKKEGCYFETQQKEKLRRVARYYANTEYGKSLEQQVANFLTPSCDDLSKISQNYY